MNPTKRQRERGMTLLEVMISVAVFTIASSAIVSQFVCCLTLETEARESRCAALEAQNIIDDIQAIPFDDIATTFQNGQPIASYSNRNESLPNESASVTYPNVSADPLELKATVYWTSAIDNKSRSFSLSTIRTR